MAILHNKTATQAPTEAPGEANAAAAPHAAIEPAAIREQLERILASSHFRNSKRYPALLRFVVERTLDGRASELKERNVAVDVFGRAPSYDPSVDPVVRVSAGEVRKRLAQYYQEPGRENEIRFELPLGSYLPEFSLPAPVLVNAPAVPLDPAPERRFSIPGVAILSVAGALILVALAVLATMKRPTALDQFWRPATTPAGNPVLLCFGGSGPRMPGIALPENTGALRVPWWDAETLARLAGLLQAKGASVQMIREDQATFDDFQQAPAVLIGAFNDAWTLRLMEKMRFTFQRDGSVLWVSDREHPELRSWKIDMSQTDGKGRLSLKEDYAVISRVSNPRTGRITITVAGLFGFGTLAAGKFLTDPAYLQEMSKQAPAGWQDRNMQIVIGTEVIQENSGPARILATAFW